MLTIAVAVEVLVRTKTFGELGLEEFGVVSIATVPAVPILVQQEGNVVAASKFSINSDTEAQVVEKATGPIHPPKDPSLHLERSHILYDVDGVKLSIVAAT